MQEPSAVAPAGNEPVTPAPPRGERVTLLQKILIGDIIIIALFSAIFIFYEQAARVLGTYKDVIFGAMGILLASLIALVLDRVIGRVRHLNASALDISRGDLSRPVSIPTRWRLGHDEMDDLAATIGEMQTRLRELVSHIQRTSQQVSTSASGLIGSTQAVSGSTDDVARAMADIARGAEEQLRLVEGAERVIASMARLVEQNADHAANATRNAEATQRAATAGSAAAETAGERIRSVFARIEGASREVFDFGEKTQEIANVVEAFTMVSQQTQLLALNAAIEAARAGEYGRGFGVVAEEVQRLADSAGRSATQIAALSSEISERSRTAVTAMRTSIDELSSGRAELDRIIGALESVSSAAAGGADQVRMIGAAAAAQQAGSSEMVASVADIARVARQNSAATENVSSTMREQAARASEMSAAARELAHLSRKLQTVVSRFKLE